jgi:hypothetical protein
MSTQFFLPSCVHLFIRICGENLNFRMKDVEVKLYRLSVGQSVLVSGSYLEPMTRFFFCLTILGFLMWGALSDERMCL